ncbi:hypothetical protein HFD88_010504 [Aspergillus terreus]|nr:hypothetical protein HFD88_010504 [Aspergillus terreus]
MGRAGPEETQPHAPLVRIAAKALADKEIPMVEYGQQIQWRHGDPVGLLLVEWAVPDALLSVASQILSDCGFPLYIYPLSFVGLALEDTVEVPATFDRTLRILTPKPRVYMQSLICHLLSHPVGDNFRDRVEDDLLSFISFHILGEEPLDTKHGDWEDNESEEDFQKRLGEAVREMKTWDWDADEEYLRTAESVVRDYLMFLFHLFTGSSNTTQMQSTQTPPEKPGAIPVTENGNRTITVNEYETIWGVGSKKERLLKQSETFDVDSNILIEKSSYFTSMFRGRWREASAPIDLEDTRPRSMEIWLRAFHGSLDGLPLESWFDLQQKKDERGEYDDLDDNEFEKRLLYPCFKFDCAVGFQTITKQLVYDVDGHIEERNPTHVFQMHLPARVIQQLNAARGRLRAILHRDLFDQIKLIVDYDSCACKALTVYHYEHELRRIGVWPLEETAWKLSINTMLERLGRFDEERMRKRIAGDVGEKRLCRLCNQSWGQVVKKAADVVRKYFDGLCLDCMDTSKSMTGLKEYHDDYWQHNEVRNRYDSLCRIRHGEPTWYFSFMGRRERSGLAG